MTKGNLIIILVVIIVIIFLSLYLTVRCSPVKEDNEILKKLDSLELKLDSLSNKKDSIREIITNTDKEIVNNEKHYQTTVNNIIVQSDSTLSESNRQYIIEYATSRGYHIRGTQ